MKYKYIALDFDGTILNSKHKLSEELKEMLINFQEQGIKVFLCSGRNIGGMKKIMQEINTLHYDTYVVSCNGGEVFKIKNGEMINVKSNLFDHEDVKVIKALVKDEAKTMLAFEGENTFIERFNLKTYYHQLKVGRRPGIGINRAVNKMLLIDNVEHINSKYDKVKSLLKVSYPDVKVFRSLPTLIEIAPPGSTKGEALDQIFKENGYDKSELIAFGDGENDIEMLEYAGHGVCMANGFDTTKAVSNDIALTNDENGVYKYLLGLINE